MYQSMSNRNGMKLLHPRSAHHGLYDYDKLITQCPQLQHHIIKNPSNENTIDYTNSESVYLLNKALLSLHYNIKHWEIPQGYLCPPIPG